MYFLEQIRRQFMFTLTLGVGGPEGTNEAVVQQENETPKAEVTLGEALDHARETTANLNSAVETQEALGLSDSGPNNEIFESMTSEEREAAELAIDALQPGENPSVGEDLTENEIISTQAALEKQVEVAQQKVLMAPEGSQERAQAENILSFDNALLNSIAQTLQGVGPESGAAASDGLGIAGDVLATSAKFTDMNGGKGLSESNTLADQFLDGKDADKTPWCAGYANKILEKSGFKGTGSLMARSFLACTGEPIGPGHVGFMTPDKKCAGGNQSDKANIQKISKPIEGWVMPSDVGNPNKTITRKKDGPEAVDKNNIPAGAVIVFKRGGGNNWA